MLKIFFYTDRNLNGRVAAMREGEEEGDVLRRVCARVALGTVTLDESQVTKVLEKMIEDPEFEEQLNWVLMEIIRAATQSDRLKSYALWPAVEKILAGINPHGEI